MIKKPYNLISYQKSTKFLNFVTIIITNFTDTLGVKRAYFSKFLPYSDSQFNKYLNPQDETKNLKLTDFIHIIDNLDRSSQFEMIDWFCEQYDFTIVDNQKELKNNETLETLLLKMTSTNGTLSNQFLEAIKDDDINDYEQSELKSIARQFRSLLRTFENRLEDV